MHGAFSLDKQCLGVLNFFLGGQGFGQCIFHAKSGIFCAGIIVIGQNHNFCHIFEIPQKFCDALHLVGIILRHIGDPDLNSLVLPVDIPDVFQDSFVGWPGAFDMHIFI